MKRSIGSVFLGVIAALALTGCLSSPTAEMRQWTVEWRTPPDMAASRPMIRQKLPSVRLSHVTVRAPYSGTHLAVLRPDGSVAFDSYNAFAAQPAAILRGATVDALEASGRIAKVLPPTSSAAAAYTLEVSVTRLALDCREEGRRNALVALTAALVKDRAVVAVGKAEASAPTRDGDYSAAFSKAFADAIVSAGRDLNDELGK